MAVDRCATKKCSVCNGPNHSAEWKHDQSELKAKGGDMVNLIIHRYGGNVPGWKGCVEPEDRTWILYCDADGRPAAYYGRRGPSGAVVEASLVKLS